MYPTGAVDYLVAPCASLLARVHLGGAGDREMEVSSSVHVRPVDSVRGMMDGEEQRYSRVGIPDGLVSTQTLSCVWEAETMD